MDESLDFEEVELTEEELAHYFEGIGAIAHADGELSDEEIELFTENRDNEELSDVLAQLARTALRDPQPIQDTCRKLRGSPARYNLYLDACEMAHADGVVKPSEESALDSMARQLDISDEKAEALMEFAEASFKFRQSSGERKERAKEALKEASASLAGAGVSIGVVAASGSTGLSAAGISSGLAALGLGAGMIGGIAVVAGIGAASYTGIKKLFD
jgi:uncharacterized iron-regulated protein